jgi:hypothetical protein
LKPRLACFAADSGAVGSATFPRDRFHIGAGLVMTARRTRPGQGLVGRSLGDAAHLYSRLPRRTATPCPLPVAWLEELRGVTPADVAHGEGASVSERRAEHGRLDAEVRNRCGAEGALQRAVQ